MFPLVESVGESRVALGSEVLEKWGGSLQDLGVDFGESVHGGDVANEPDLIGIQEHNFSSMRVGLNERRLVGEVAIVGDAWGEFSR